MVHKSTQVQSGGGGGGVTEVDTGTGLSGGPITTTGTIVLADTAVTPGAYTSANLTVDQQGRITAAASGAAGGVTSVANSDGTLTISPTTGAAVASLALGHANTWTGQQTFVAPILGTPASGVATNLTGTASGLTAGTVTTNANLTGDVTSVGNATTIGAGKVTEAMQVLANNTTNNVSITKHGYAPIAPNDATKYLDGTGAYSTPASGSGTVTTTGTPASGNLSKFSGATSVTNGDLAGDVTTSGTLTTTVAKISGVTVSGTTGTVNSVFSNSPALVTPDLGTPSALVGTNITGTAASLTAGNATNAVNTGITDDTTTNATMYPTWVTANTGNLPEKVSSTKLTFNPSTGVLASTTFSGAGTSLTGTAASLTAGTVTTNANLTGPVTSVGNATAIASSVALPGSPTTTTQAQGTSNTTVSTTAYVDTAVANAIAGVNPAVAVQAATTQASDTSGLTYNNGVSGIGATLTGSNNTAITWDGYTFTAVGQRGLVKNDTQSPSGAFNGVYYVTQIQTAILPPILTRALDYDMPSDINNTGAIPVVNGTVNTKTSWLLTSTVTTVGTDPLTYTQFSINPTTILSNSLPSANVFVGNGSNVATGVAVSGDLTAVNTGAFTVAKINSTVVSGTTGSTNVVFSNSPVLVTPALGTPASGTLTSCAGLPISSGVSGLGTGVAAFLGTPSSANLLSAVTGATGSAGGLVFATGPTLSNPVVGTQTTGDNSTKAASTAFVSNSLWGATAYANYGAF